VDPKARRDFWDELRALTAKGMTVLVSTHYMDEAQRCDQLAYIAFGKLLAVGTAEELIAANHAPDLEAVFVELMKGTEDNFQ
jgi:ABC-2 type transport system ATP-binding protein